MTPADDPANTTNRVARVFGLSGDSWLRHSNPWSVWTRRAADAGALDLEPGLDRAALPGPAGPVAGVAVRQPAALPAAAVHPQLGLARSPRRAHLVGARAISELPRQFDSRAPAVAQLCQVVGLVPLTYGLIDLGAIATVTGTFIVQVAKLWYIDRMVLLFNELKTDSRYAAWDF